jgi:hypothetical protein
VHTETVDRGGAPLPDRSAKGPSIMADSRRPAYAESLIRTFAALI